MRRAVTLLGEALVTGLFLLAVVAVVLAGSPLGTGLVAHALGDLSGGRVSVTGARGALLTGIRAEAMQVRLDTVAVDLDALELAVAWPDLLRGELRLRTARAGRLRVHATPDPDKPDTPVAPLDLPFIIAADDLRLATVEVQVRDAPPTVLEDVRFAGRLAGGELDFRDLGLRFAGIAFAAAGRFGTGEPFALGADATVDWPAVGITGRGRIDGSLAELRVNAGLAAPEPIALDATARLLDAAPAFTATLRGDRVARVVAAADGRELVVAGFAVDVAGWLDDLRATAAGTLALAGYPALRVAAAAEGTPERLRFGRITVDGLGGRITADGTLVLAPAPAGDLAFAGTGLDPAALDPRFAGRIDAAGTAAFAADGSFRVRVDRATGELLGRRFGAEGGVARSADEWRAEGVRVAAGPNRVELDGRWGTAIAGRFRIDAPELGLLWPGLAGRLRGSGEVGGTLAAPSLAVDLAGGDLSFDDIGVRALAVRGGIVRRDRIDLDLDARGIAAGGVELGDLDAGVSGRLADHALRVRLAGGEFGLDVDAAGTLGSDALVATVSAARVALPGDFAWQLDEPVRLRATAGDVAVAAHCWASDPARLCLADTRFRGSDVAGEATLRGFPLARLAPWLPDDVTLGGSVDADVAARRDAGRWTGRLRVEPRGATVAWRVPDDEDVRTELTEALLEVEATDAAVDYRAVLADTFGLRLAARGQVRDPFAAEPAIDGTITGGIPDLARLSSLADRFIDVAGLAGRVQIDATLGGRLRAPTITGGLELADGALTVPAAGITVDRIGLTVTGTEPGRATVLGTARSGKGFVRITGLLAWDDRFVPAARLVVRGRVFDVINIPAGLVQVSPDVTAELVDGQFRVGGEVLVPRAEIRPRRIDAGAVGPSPDTVVHGRETPQVARGRPLFVLDGLRVRLGRDIRVDGLGLRSGARGAITLYQNLPDDPFAVTADGVLELVDGRFTVLGQVLDIERGSLRFAGLVTDPGIDVKASREAVYEGRTVTAGVVLSGLLSRIETRVYSEPAMGEMDALSYLTTGKPLADASAGDRFAVANAALALGMRGALPTAQTLGEAIRVDELGVEGTGGENTAVYVGERFGEDLYVRYSYGIFDQIGTIRATYRIGRRFSIEGSSGQAQALDLIYSITW